MPVTSNVSLLLLPVFVHLTVSVSSQKQFGEPTPRLSWGTCLGEDVENEGIDIAPPFWAEPK